MFFRSKTAAIGAGLYLLTFACAAIYPFFDRRTFSGLAAVLLAWPWIDVLPKIPLVLGVAMNALIIYAVLSVLSLAVVSVRRHRK